MEVNAKIIREERRGKRDSVGFLISSLIEQFNYLKLGLDIFNLLGGLRDTFLLHELKESVHYSYFNICLNRL